MVKETTCEKCRAMDMEWRTADDAKDDLVFRMRRRALFHVLHCMTPLEKIEWLRAGGMSQIRKLGA